MLFLKEILFMRKRCLFIILVLSVLFSSSLFSQTKEKKVLYFVIPVENGKKPNTQQYFPLFEQTTKEKILYYLEPMEKKVKSYTPKKDDMGMDYIPYYVEESTKKLLFYINPMDKKTKSDKPKKDDMGMDYIPVFEAKVYTK
jgi:hypothetical protein